MPSLIPTNTSVASSLGINYENGVSEDGMSPKRYHSLTDIYEQGNFAVATFGPQNFDEAAEEEKWGNAMKE